MHFEGKPLNLMTVNFFHYTVLLITIGKHINDHIVCLACNLKSITTTYRLDTATEDGFRYLEYHDAKI